MTSDKTTAIGELPNRIDHDDRGALDDIVLTNVSMFRMEWVDSNQVWIRCYRDDGPSDVVFLLGSKKKITGSYEIEPPACERDG